MIFAQLIVDALLVSFFVPGELGLHLGDDTAVLVDAWQLDGRQ